MINTLDTIEDKLYQLDIRDKKARGIVLHPVALFNLVKDVHHTATVTVNSKELKFRGVPMYESKDVNLDQVIIF